MQQQKYNGVFKVTTYVMRDGKLVDREVAGPKNTTSSATNIIRDEMDATRHMADGNIYTSKSRFRETTKANCCIEVGNSSPTQPRKPIPLDRGQRREAIRQALYQVRNGRS